MIFVRSIQIWGQFCRCARTRVFMPVFSSFLRDEFLVSQERKCLDLTKKFPSFLSLQNNTKTYFDSFIFHIPYFISNQTYPNNPSYYKLLDLYKRERKKKKRSSGSLYKLNNPSYCKLLDSYKVILICMYKK